MALGDESAAVVLQVRNRRLASQRHPRLLAWRLPRLRVESLAWTASPRALRCHMSGLPCRIQRRHPAGTCARHVAREMACEAHVRSLARAHTDAVDHQQLRRDARERHLGHGGQTTRAAFHVAVAQGPKGHGRYVAWLPDDPPDDAAVAPEPMGVRRGRGRSLSRASLAGRPFASGRQPLISHSHTHIYTSAS